MNIKTALLIIITLSLTFAFGVSYAEEAEAPPPPANNAEVQAAVERGLAYLASIQNKDGSWGSGSYSRHVGITGISVMAFMSQGNVPGRGKYGHVVRDGVAFILKNVNPHSGFISHGPNSRMYEHGFATLALAEALGMEHNEDLADKLRKAVRLIIRAQKPDGGWRYDPTPSGLSDLSVTVCQIMALRAARNAGINVPKEVIDNAIDYVKKSANPNGSFRYMQSQGSGGSYAMTGAGVTTLFGAGLYDSPEIERGINHIRQSMGANHGHYYYGHYYAAQAMYQAGGDHWRDWFARVSAELLKRQQPNGSWSGEVNDAYCTAMACITLQTHTCYLPIFQR